MGVPKNLPGRAALPSQRKHVWALNPLPASPETWLKERQQRDEKCAGVPPNLWLIHGKLYDLHKFMDRHPGGREWLQFTMGMDCTVEFETHHLDSDKVESILSKYYVRDAELGKIACVKTYTFEQNGFYRTFKRRAHAILREHGGAQGGRIMEMVSLLAIVIWMTSFAATCITGSPAVATVAGVLLLAMFGVGHNYFHQRNHPLRYAMDLTFAGHHQWRISHAISHHGFPVNLDLDIELTQFEPLYTYIRSQRGYGRWIYFGVIPFLLIAGGMDITRTWTDLLLKPTSFRWEQMIRILQLVLLIMAQGPLLGLWLFFIMHTVGALALFIASFPVHRTEYAWSDGCQPVEEDKEDFGEHVVSVAHDYALDFGVFGQLFLAGSFSNHIIHHLLPTLDLSKQYLLLPLLDEVCAEFKVRRYKRYFSDLLLSTLSCFSRTPQEGLKYHPNRDPGKLPPHSNLSGHRTPPLLKELSPKPKSS